MKGVMLNAGEGKRLAPITYCVHKGLVPVYDRPALMYQIDFFADMEIDEVALVVPAGHEKSYRDFLGRIDTRGVRIRVYVQGGGSGVFAACRSCMDFIRDSDIVMLMGDCLCFIGDMDVLKDRARACFEHDRVGIVRGRAQAGIAAAFFEQTGGDGAFRYDYRIMEAGELCPIGLHFIPRSLTASIDGFIRPDYTEMDAATFSTALIRAGKLELPELSPGDRWFDIGTAEQLFRAGACARSILQDR